MKIEINNLPIKVGVRVITDILVSDNSYAFDKLNKLGREYRKRFADLPISKIEGVQAARSFFRAIGIDPTKRRPSSEALLRRALNNKDFYKVNNIVDLGNLFSLKFLLPICIYDLDAIKGNVIIRIGNKEDEYLAHNHKIMNFEDKFVICDDLGAFGSPLKDSLRTAVTRQTRKLLVIIFAPENYCNQKLESYLEQIMLGMKD